MMRRFAGLALSVVFATAALAQDVSLDPVGQVFRQQRDAAMQAQADLVVTNLVALKRAQDEAEARWGGLAVQATSERLALEDWVRAYFDPK